MNWKKHEGSLLEALSDAGSTPAASTIFSPSQGVFFSDGAQRRFYRGFWEKWVVLGGVLVVFSW